MVTTGVVLQGVDAVPIHAVADDFSDDVRLVLNALGEGDERDRVSS